MPQLRVLRNNLEAVLNRIQFVRDAHADMAIDKLGLALGMEGNEAKGYWLPIYRAFVIKAMLQKGIQKIGGFCVRRSRTCRAAHVCVWQRSAHARDRIIIELEVIGLCSVPVNDVRLVPHFEVPGTHLFPPIALNKMLGIFMH